jgi:hypothetical protein
MGGYPCQRCHQPIRAGELWELDHTDDRTGYLGASHRSCNRRAGAAKGNARKRAAAERMERVRRATATTWLDHWNGAFHTNCAECVRQGAACGRQWSEHWANGSGFDPRCPDCARLGRVCDEGKPTKGS